MNSAPFLTGSAPNSAAEARCNTLTPRCQNLQKIRSQKGKDRQWRTGFLPNNARTTWRASAQRATLRRSLHSCAFSELPKFLGGAGKSIFRANRILFLVRGGLLSSLMDASGTAVHVAIGCPAITALIGRPRFSQIAAATDARRENCAP